MYQGMELLNKAIVLAATYHDHQKDKAGQPYILHPLRIMMQAETIEEKIVAVLHDIIEDTFIRLRDLKLHGFSEYIIRALDCLTKRDDETYFDFIRRISENELATKIKILDLKDNMNLDRLPEVTIEDLNRQVRYRKALEILE